MTSSLEDFGRGLATVNRYGSTSESKPYLHFSAANGMPAASYDYFIEQFCSQYNVVSLENRGVWPSASSPDRRRDWMQHVKDLIAFLDAEGKAPYVGVGHSMGGWCTAVAANLRPDLFSHIVLIDPASLPHRSMSFVLKHFPRLAYRVPMVKKAVARRNHWDSEEQFFERMHSKMVYKSFTELAMRSYAKHGLKPTEQGLQLSFSPVWEGHNFSKTPYVWGALKKVKCPALVLRAEKSYIHKAKGFTKAMRAMPSNVSGQVLAGLGHLAPQENHQLVHQVIETWLAEQG